MADERIDQLWTKFTREQNDLENLQDKTVARLQFIEGALSVLEELKKEQTNAQ